MGNLSEHFNSRDFVCRCGQCRSDIRIHLGLVGALEMIGFNFKRTPRIASAYRCEYYNEKHNIGKKNSHSQGKAAHIYIDSVALNDLYNFAKTVPEIRGLGYYPDDKCIHIDTRSLDKGAEKDEWYKEGGKLHPMTTEAKARFGLL